MTAMKRIVLKEIHKIKIDDWLKINPQKWKYLWKEDVWKKYKPKKITNEDAWNRMYQICSKNPLWTTRVTAKDKHLLDLVASVGDSVGAYISSLFQNITKWKYFENAEGNPFQSCIDLWNAGFVPSFDGEIWRLHSGKDAKIVYEIKKGEL